MKSPLFVIALIVLIGVASAQIPIPGGNSLLAMGFDRVTGQPSADPVFLFHNTLGQTWYPPDNPSLVYSIPDEVYLLPTYTSEEYVGESISMSYQEWFKSYFMSFNINIGINTNEFSLSFKWDHEVAEAKDYLSSRLLALGMSYHWYSLYQLGAAPARMLTLHPFFQMAVNRLPPTISNEDDQIAYDDIIRYFGTDIVYQSNFGCRVDVNSFVNMTTINQKTQKWVSDQISLNFHYLMFDISPGFFRNKSEIHVDDEFLKNAFTRIYFRGGNPIYQNNNTLTEWVKSIETYPQYLNISMQPLSNVVTDKQKAATLNSVIQKYIKDGKLVSDSPSFRLKRIRNPIHRTASIEEPMTPELMHKIRRANAAARAPFRRIKH